MMKLARRRTAAATVETAPTCRDGAEPRGLARRLIGLSIRLASSAQVLALLDQAVVSGASFVTTVLIGRYTFPSQLGQYMLAGSILIWLVNAQESLVTLPYTLRLGRDPASPRHAGNALALSGLLAVLALVGVGSAGAVVALSGGGLEVTAIMLILATVAPFVILREFARRFAFAHLRVIHALALDSLVAALQIGVLGALAWTGTLSTFTALAALGAACAAAGVSWLLLARHEFKPGGEPLRSALRENWTMGKWLFANQLLAGLQSQATFWLVAIAVGTTATGIYTACQSIAMLANPLILGLSNTLWARAVRAFREGGRATLLRQSAEDTLLLAAVLGVFCAIMLVASEQILALLFPHSAYAGHGDVVVLLTFGQLAYAIGMPASSGLSGMGYVRANFIVASAETAVGIVLVWLLAAEWGVLGAAYGVLLGYVFRSVVRWAVFVPMSRTAACDVIIRESTAPVDRLLQRLACGADRWRATALVLDGSQGHVFAAARENGRSVTQPVADLVVKIYRIGRGIDAAEMKRQYETVGFLRARLHGRTFHGWTMLMPAPVLLSEVPRALVMTRVPGTTLARALTEPGLTARLDLETAAAAVADAMIEVWCSGQWHGDLTIENILCDRSARTLSFVDGGGKAECGKFQQNGVVWPAAVHDLAHLIVHEGETLATTWMSRRARRGRKRFIEGVLNRVIKRGPQQTRSEFLASVDRCVRAHLQQVETFRGPYGLWRSLKARIALARSRQLLTALTV